MVYNSVQFNNLVYYTTLIMSNIIETFLLFVLVETTNYAADLNLSKASIHTQMETEIYSETS